MGSKSKEAQLRIIQRIVTSRIRKIDRVWEEAQVIVLVAPAIRRIRQLNINHNSAQCLPAMHLCRILWTKYNHLIRQIFSQRQQHQLFNSMETLRNSSKFCLLPCKTLRRKLRTQNLVFSKLTWIMPPHHNILLRRRRHLHRSLIREWDLLLFYTYISNFRALDQPTIPLICLLFPQL